jgi:hypothetical protein
MKKSSFGLQKTLTGYRGIVLSMLSALQVIHNKYSASAQEVTENCGTEKFDHSVDSTISQAATEGFAAWKRHDDAASDFCELHGKC